MTELFLPGTLGWLDAMMRIGAATLLPLAIGLERFVHKKPIDFRPFVIISVAACALILGAFELMSEGRDPVDPTRVMEGVITGIGFIGAGAMFRQGKFVQGAGSAASIWCAGAIGLLCGMGEVWLAGIVAAIVLALLLISGPFTGNWDPASVQSERDSEDAL
ncbi:MgtC/SapB family protein [Erythrobacter sp. SDW2]|uniref:MgtC/SapB family protein n=1 Tax=Erythrobacter sp. SDW2 TaxID=2907154 RepID=UPI001F2D3A2C|nr:MgtC/SapB family protein [Erythrobacter sp. SDW2]UIP08041.1 MgtC/SapB family protein [Erythrobacter sp. SDW2]